MARKSDSVDPVGESDDSQNTQTPNTKHETRNTKAQPRFSILAADNRPIATTDDPIGAYGFVCRGLRVIDHANGDREYDGMNPGRGVRSVAINVA